MRFVPHEHQRFATEYIKSHPISLLFLDMGLGKTAITLTAIRDLKNESRIGKVLVVAPLRVATTVWPVEVSKWDHLRSLRVSVVTGTPSQRAAALSADADIFVINRENVPWLVEHLENMKRDWPFDMVVIDELSSFKNHKAIRFKALKKVRPYIRRMVGLTGTPAPNGLMDLWAEVGLIDKGERLGRFLTQYQSRWFRPGAMDPSRGIVFNYIPLPGAAEEIEEKISDITISMRSCDHLSMPSRFFTDHMVEMDSREKALYEELKREMIVSLDDAVIDAPCAAVLSNKLQQLANGAIYSEVEHGASRSFVSLHAQKLDALEDLIESANGQNVLVAYWFRHDRDRILERLRHKKIPARELKYPEDIRAWNEGEIPVALISPASAGHGLNIQSGGHILIWYSLCWSLELYEQTNARLWRQGQTHPVTIHHILCGDTIDLDILNALKRKSDTQSALIDAVKAQLLS